MSDSQSLNEARAIALELAARLVVRELDDEAIGSLQSPPMRDALSAYDSQCAAYIDELGNGSDAALESAATEFCSLFLIGKRTSPHASAWIGSNPAETGATVSRAVTEWMEQLGVEVAPGSWGNIPQDHLAVLCGLVSLALLAPQPAGEMLARRIADATLSWVPAFANAVANATENPLYRAAARLAEHALGDLTLSGID